MISRVHFSGQTSRFCAGNETVNATWHEPNFSECVSSGYKTLHQEVRQIVYCSKIRPLLEYASPVGGGVSKYLADELESTQNRCLDIIWDAE